MCKLVILFSVLSLCFNGAFGKGVIISLPGRSVQLKGEVADFGYQFDLQRNHPANLMLPPTEDDAYLCEYPASLENATPKRNNESFTPIALFVSRGVCSFEQKARVALALQQNFTQDIKYVIIYNNDRENPSQLIRMGAPNLDVPSLGFIAVSTRAGSYAMSSIIYYSQATETSPNLSVNETDWSYPIDIEEFRSFMSGGRAGANTFYTLRFVLFTVLILAPCLRALYLWWNGGGRIEFRRNERGRITGLQYRRPIPYWFAPSAQGGGQARPERSRLLTEQEVRDLPEITYVKTANDDDDSTEECSSSLLEENDLSLVVEEEPDIVVEQEQPIVVGGGKVEKDEEKGVGRQQEPTNVVGEASEPTCPPEAAPAEQAPPTSDLTTSCTTCSICIDDFEDGERIRVLPKCRHAFHTDCLMPWLTIRQACCPLCKRNVLGPDDDQESSSDGEGDADVEQGVEMGQIQPVEVEQVRDQGVVEAENQGESEETGNREEAQLLVAPSLQPSDAVESQVHAQPVMEGLPVVPPLSSSEGAVVGAQPGVDGVSEAQQAEPRRAAESDVIPPPPSATRAVNANVPPV